MSKKGRRQRSDLPEQVVWVRTSPTVDGKAYVVTLELGQDTAYAFTRDTAFQYGAYVFEVAARAEYDAAVRRQMTGDLRLSETVVGKFILDLRDDRPELDGSAWPVQLTPGVSASTGQGFITIEVRGEPIGQWTVQDARGHAAHVIEAVAAADLDAAYYRMLRGAVGAPESVARAAVGDLSKWRY